ncbi:GNAT family N-acetyltransferase [Methylobacillus caricis]|uniref:GNAT family N-acetyltransferase n=1 Tax=Methylobacillus caricis TaxID=1971611 RepID=UPI001D000228|nr:GNAT family N-acetyltransferase [Methylobacillus caricis]MCB5186538.1 GNAT family N-acetyltransferase [Methylobacillus caricis]
MSNASGAVHIDSANLEDIPALCDLLHQLFSIEQDFTPDLEKQRAGLTLLIQQPDRGTIMVARDAKGHAIGMVSAQLVISTAQGAPSAWIEDMVINSAWRNKGLGKSLLQAILDWASQQGATRAQLLVDMDNAPAIAYYDHLGWHTTRLQARSLLL